ncbi:MAG: acyl-CoA/acyl-ACP dehydrogenase [Gammaproteobacteria bacterium]|nr:acyl-CoA/acyl-ACP dehydrogenase [Gammaproteobacteria bacterium]
MQDSHSNPIQRTDISTDVAIGAIDSLRQQIRKGLQNIKAACTVNKEFDSDLIDHYQNASFELAFCEAEISAASTLIDFNKQSDKQSIDFAIAILFAAESFRSVIARLRSIHIDANLSLEKLAALERSNEARALLSSCDGNFTAEIGSRIAQDEITRLSSGVNEEKELMRETFFRFANEVVAPLAEEIHREDKDIPEAIIKPAAELGCFGTCIPERFGGLQPDDEPDSLGMIVVTEELSRGSLGAAGSLITRPEIAARALLAGGTEAQQQHWLPKLAAGKILCAISITEPNTGSDVAAVTLKATPTEGGWLLNGSKTWCTFAGKSELIVALARSNPDASLGYKGLSMFLIEKPSYPGRSFKHDQEAGGTLTGKAIATLGYRGMHSYDLFFEDYFVPTANLVGEESGEGKGFYYTMAGFSGGRIQTAARATGLMQAAFERALSYANERVVFDQSLSEFQLTRIKLARMLATITACRQFSYAVARQMDEGQGQMEASLVKLFSCRAAEWITREALQIHGGMGYAEESAVSRYFVDARVLSIFEGSEEVLALKVIARGLIEKA